MQRNRLRLPRGLNPSMDTQSQTLGIRKILIYQVIVSCLVILAWSMDSIQAVMAASYGAVMAITVSLLLAWRARRLQKRPVDDPHGDLRVVFFAAFERLAIVSMLLVAGFGVLQLSALPLLTSFFTGYAVLTILSLEMGLISNGR